MTPKEKAEQLVDKFRSNIISFLSDNMKDQNAQKCALVAVDEIQKLPNIGHNHNQDESQYDYWQEVKQEIEKI